MKEYTINVPIHLNEQAIVDLIDGKLCRLPPFCIDPFEMDQMVYYLSMEGKLGEKARLAASKMGFIG